MAIKKLTIILGLCVLITGCSTTYQADGIYGSKRSYTATQMGVRYLLGRGVPQDKEKAFYYFSRGAQDDDPFAQSELAYMYAAGKGTPKDFGKAFYWYKKAAEHGLAGAQYNLGLLYLKGLGTPVDKAQALYWFKKSAAHGFEPARSALAQNSADSA